MATTTNDDFDYGSPTVPEGALFVAADEPLLVFVSVAAAEAYLEAIDVDEGVYGAAYGPRGEVYHLGSDGDRVTIARSGEPDRPEALKALLLHYLEQTGRPGDEAASLERLVAEVWAIESDFLSSRDPWRFGSYLPLVGCLAFLVMLMTAFYFGLR